MMEAIDDYTHSLEENLEKKNKQLHHTDEKLKYVQVNTKYWIWLRLGYSVWNGHRLKFYQTSLQQCIIKVR